MPSTTLRAETTPPPPPPERRPAALLEGPATDEAVTRCLQAAGQVAVLLRTEDARLSEVGLASKMPAGWSLGDDPLARYEDAGIVLSDKVLKVSGAICR